MPLVLRAKCVVIGDNAVGKTSLVQSFASDGTQFSKAYTMTTSADICVKAVQIPDTDVTVELYIYDCAGEETFYDFVQQFWEDFGMVLIVYDVTNEESLTSCSKWLKRIRACKLSPATKLPAALVACKVDLEDRRTVITGKGEEFAYNSDLEYFECSAKHHENCEKPFLALAEKYATYYESKTQSLKT